MTTAERNKYITDNLGLVQYVAKYYENYGLDMDDLRSEGSIGLITAVDTFDVGHGCRFSTYAVACIRTQIRRALTKTSRTVRIPDHVADALQQYLRKATHTYVATGKYSDYFLIPSRIKGFPKYGHSPIIRCSGITELAENTKHDSDGGDVTRHVFPKTDGYADVFHAEAEDRVDELLAKLTDKQAQTLIYRWQLHGQLYKTHKEIGKLFKVSTSRAQQLEQEALLKLKKQAKITHK